MRGNETCTWIYHKHTFAPEFSGKNMRPKASKTVSCEPAVKRNMDMSQVPFYTKTVGENAAPQERTKFAIL